MRNENEIYHADTTRISKSGLDLISKSPAKYYARYLDPNAPKKAKTEALIRGSAFHTITLEEHKFSDEFVIDPGFTGTGSTAKKNEFHQAHIGKTLISLDTYQTVSRMRDAVWKHPLAKMLFSNGEVEQQINFEDPHTGARVKTKPDYRNTDNKIIVDLKSTQDASDAAFALSAYKYRYHVQAGLYIDAAALNGLDPTEFVFIAVESTYPHLVKIYFAPTEVIMLGRQTYQQDLQTYSRCLETGVWPGYDQRISPLGLPGWVKM